MTLGVCVAVLLGSRLPARATPPIDVDEPPTARAGLPSAAAARVRAGRSLAARHLASFEACSELFRPFDADGQQLLHQTRVLRANAEAERRWCRKGAVLLTHLGEPGEVWACSGAVERLGRSEVAALLVHEALHHAGQNEWPHEPKAPTPQEITARVRAACRL